MKTTVLPRVRLIGGKLSRAVQGCWQVIEVALLHAKHRMLEKLRPSTGDDVAALTAAIADADVVSFDLYDTLMARCIHEPGDCPGFG